MSDATTANVAITHTTVDTRRFPGSRGLLNAYIHDFPSVSAFFTGDSSKLEAWRATIRGVLTRKSTAPLAEILLEQLRRRDTPREAVSAAEAFRGSKAVAIVTGQQAGLFGGPLYTLLKAVTAIRLARWVRHEFDVPAVPVFWVEDEDHDWQETRSASFLDDKFQLQTATAADPIGAGAFSIASLRIADPDGALSLLRAGLPPSESTDWLIAALARRYRDGVSMSDAFAGWMDDLLGRHGLVVYQAHDPAAKQLVADVFVSELSGATRTAALVRECAAAMRQAGYDPQIDPPESSTALFYLGADGRLPIRTRVNGFDIGDRLTSRTELQQEATTHPERFSPNVLLRPIVQDRLFPTICYVGGPAELVYQAQLRAAYVAFGVQPPLLHPRLSATLLDSAASRFLHRYKLPLEALHDRADMILNRVMAQELPEGIEGTFDDAVCAIVEHGARIRALIAPLDPTLVGALETTVERAREAFAGLHRKVVQAAKRKDETLRRQVERTHTLVFPGGAPQERTLSGVYFLNRYGEHLCERLLEIDPLTTGQHHVLVL